MNGLRSKDGEHALRALAESSPQPSGEDLTVFRDGPALELAARWGVHLADVYEEAMELGLCPLRYARNRESVTLAEQIRLLRSQVCVVGAGGLGGQVVLILARVGVGHLVVIDHDRFDETNLNRQALSRTPGIGSLKAEEAAREVAAVNPAVKVIPHVTRLSRENAEGLLAGCQVAVDALDNIPDRFLLEDAARRLRIPLVHAALAGFEGQLMTIFPEDGGMASLYGDPPPLENRSSSAEAVMGVPAPTPAVLAALQCMEVLKILLGRGRPLRNAMLHVDLETGSFDTFSFAPHPSPDQDA